MSTSANTSQHPAVVGKLSTLDRFLPVWIGVAMVVGLLVAGIGGRLVMRLAALLVPDSVGRFTENGNVIGTITLDGEVGKSLGHGRPSL